MLFQGNVKVLCNPSAYPGTSEPQSPCLLWYINGMNNDGLGIGHYCCNWWYFREHVSDGTMDSVAAEKGNPARIAVCCIFSTNHTRMPPHHWSQRRRKEITLVHPILTIHGSHGRAEEEPWRNPWPQAGSSNCHPWSVSPLAMCLEEVPGKVGSRRNGPDHIVE